MKHISSQSSVIEPPRRLRKSETLLVVIPKWMVGRTLVATVAFAAVLHGMRSASRSNSPQ